MATSIHDLVSSARIKTALQPQVLDDGEPEGSSVDLGPCDGPCFAVQSVGAISASSTLTGRMEESHDETTWVAISGATFTAATASGIQVIRFLRSRRYVRWAGTFVTDSGTVAASAVVIQPFKTF